MPQLSQSQRQTLKVHSAPNAPELSAESVVRRPARRPQSATSAINCRLVQANVLTGL